ncbi:NADPH-dependent aldehyde reductase [Rhizoctonia solani AG-3 Rhs1AP]|uniref:NADPH-dependent aldehyde reductase n=2 Tax=Rhizoctonia solani AG-3 TaxID=1086053 RepID=A0A074RK96_9AGAM|nr:NADPH-dependent aldehyde reductase [Rhizoctonia solani AG-3 Rhs1AP]KEP45750.1 NADPH-dependent aldehyde reductase [Rhizoctonia solani 123E]
MPAILINNTVLVTGASGFIAVWVCQYLLEADYKVRGTVRSAAKGDYLVKLFKAYRGKFEYVIVEDIGKDGAFDEAVQGMDAIAHIASPLHFNSKEPNDIIGTAVRGTTGILESVNKHGAGVRRVIAMSSIASVTDGMYQLKIPGTVFTEKDWNTHSIQEVEKRGKDVSGVENYSASKVMAEKAAWDFVEKVKPNWDLVTFCPSLVLGPIIHEVSNSNCLNTSVAILYGILLNKDNLVDVRDVAFAHIRALGVEEAGGQRFIISSAPFCWQDALDALDLPAGLPRGTPGSGKGLDHIIFSNSKVKRLLGINFKGLKETVRDTVESLQKRGWRVIA